MAGIDDTFPLDGKDEGAVGHVSFTWRQELEVLDDEAGIALPDGSRVNALTFLMEEAFSGLNPAKFGKGIIVDAIRQNGDTERGIEATAALWAAGYPNEAIEDAAQALNVLVLGGIVEMGTLEEEVFVPLVSSGSLETKAGSDDTSDLANVQLKLASLNTMLNVGYELTTHVPVWRESL